ncbi:MAG: ATP-dependent Clp protease ATP-binding subunit, partial [Myxococcales bacterium]|nr:ATP-dependent Clp protease ATP-binding subunit [Myxococcales bacterium]
AGPLRDLGADARLFERRLEEALGAAAPLRGRDQQVPEPTRAFFRSAWDEAGRAGRAKIEAVDLIEAIFRAEDSVPARLLKEMGVDPALLALRARIHAREHLAPRTAETRNYDLPAALAQLSVSMNKQAAEGRYAPLIGREAELATMIEILCHRERANSVIITGEPGVGKSALVEGFTQRIVFDPESLPPRLRTKHVVNLQMNAVVAGTAFRGMFEERMEKILQEVREHPQIILFVDEVHTLVGAGSAMGVPADAANILKQALARGQIQLIGATTQTEYKQSIAEDGALARRFRLVHLEEPSVAEAARILEGYVPRLEGHYGVRVAPETVEMALDLSPRYQRWAHLPDKAIAWLDTACVKAEIAGRGDVEADDVIAVIAQEARVPEDMIRRRVHERFADVEEALGRRVVGQRHAIEAVARHLRLSKGPLKRNHLKPDAVFLFLGPTGVGKTELAKATSEFLFGDEARMIRVDMSEYQAGSLSVDKLIGMPRGIVGSERGGILTSQLRDRPYSVVLLDEVEKASPEVRNLFLQGFDEGWIADGRGRRVYLSDAVIIMTSNL